MYLDDVIIFSTDFEQHLRSTERVMSLLKAAGFLFTDYFTDFMSGRSFRQSSQEDVGVDKYSANSCFQGEADFSFVFPNKKKS